MKDLIIRRTLGTDTVIFWVTVFALVPRPDRHTIHALAPLLEFQREIPESQFILSYSSVIHAYCSKHGTSCINLEPIKEFTRHVERVIQNGCVPRVHVRSDIKQVRVYIAWVQQIEKKNKALSSFGGSTKISSRYWPNLPLGI